MTNRDQAIQEVCDRVARAGAQRMPLRIRGGASKDFYTGLSQTQGMVLDTLPLAGIISYEPSELVVVAGAATALRELEELLAQHGQCLPFEPPHFDGRATVGGMVATGLAGPARANVGGVRDYVLGVRLVNGLAQHLSFGGQVMKNVAGYDVSRLMTGALGTLGILTEVSLKVLPQAQAEATLVFALGQEQALEQLHRWGARPLPLNASCWEIDPQRGPVLWVRLRGAKAAIETGCRALLADVPGQRLDAAEAAALWLGCRNHTAKFFQTAPAQALLWRLSLPQTAPALSLPGPVLVEWHGAQRWLWAPAEAAPAVQAMVRAVGGQAAPYAWTPAVPASVARLTTGHGAVDTIAAQLRRAFDPLGVFNPGLISHAN